MAYLDGPYVRHEDGHIIGLSPAGIQTRDAPITRYHSGGTVSGIGALVLAVVFWEADRALMRAIYRLPHWADLVLYFLVGVGFCTAIYLAIVFVIQRIWRRRLSRKTRIIAYVLVFTAFISNFVGLPKAPAITGPSSTNTVIVPARGPSVAIPVNGWAKYVDVTPRRAVRMYAQRKLVTPETYRPFVSDELQFVSATGRPVSIAVRQFDHTPTPHELDAPPSAGVGFKR